jgi:hypothetical protein
MFWNCKVYLFCDGGFDIWYFCQELFIWDTNGKHIFNEVHVYTNIYI